MFDFKERRGKGTLIDRLDRVQEIEMSGGKHFFAKCPVPRHGPPAYTPNPTLEVQLLGEKWTLRCHGGCKVREVLTAIGIDERSLNEDRK